MAVLSACVISRQNLRNAGAIVEASRGLGWQADFRLPGGA